VAVKRAKRLEVVGKLIHDKERECALRVVATQTRLADAERRDQELRRYLREYQQLFERRARGGMGVAGVRDYQAFITRLGEAVRQQDGVIQQLKAECESARAQWRHAAARKSGIGKVLANAHSEARQLEERQVQKELDDRAQRVGGTR
jgi:flagellar protein FliJ